MGRPRSFGSTITPKGGAEEENESFTVYTESQGGRCWVRGRQLSSGTSLDVKANYLRQTVRPRMSAQYARAAPPAPTNQA